MPPAVQLGFQLRTSPNVRSVHLVGSWDHYQRQLPLAAVKDGDAKPGSWSGTFRFQGSQALTLGSRYWYYYIIDGYHVSHDPAKEWTTEKTTGRKLNVLNVPGGSSKTSATPTPSTMMSRAGLSIQTTNLPAARMYDRRQSREVVQGRALSPGKIAHPKPQKPYASRGLREADYEVSPVDDLSDRLMAARLGDSPRNYGHSPSALSDSSTSSGELFSSGPNSAGGSSCSSTSPSCRCERYGVTREGRRIKLDCGGKRCGYGDSSSSECASSESDSEEDRKQRARMRARVGGGTMKSVSSARTGENMGSRRPVIVTRQPERRR